MERHFEVGNWLFRLTCDSTYYTMQVKHYVKSLVTVITLFRKLDSEFHVQFKNQLDCMIKERHTAKVILITDIV
jgi:hypothetical protein